MKTGQKIVAILMVISFVFILTSTVMAAGDPRINRLTFIFKGKQKLGDAIDKCYASENYLRDYFGLNIEKISGNKYRIEGLYYPYTNKIKVYKGKYYFDVITFFKFFDIKYDKVSDSAFHLLDSTIPMFNRAAVMGPTEMKFKMGSSKMNVNTYKAKNRLFLSLEDLNLAPDDSKKDSSGIIKVNNKAIYRWLEKDGKIYGYIKDINHVMKANQKITPIK